MNTGGPPLSRPRKPFFGESSALRSPLDPDALNRQWQKGQQTSASSFGLQQSVRRLEGIVAQLRRRIIGMPPSTPTEPETFFPFKVYQPTGLSVWLGKTCPLIVGTSDNGVFRQCVVVAAATPTDLSANPAKVSLADTWRFIAVRSGLIEYRPIYNQGVGGIFDSIPLDPNNWGVKGPYGSEWPNPDVTDGGVYSSTVIYTDGVADWLIADGGGFASEQTTTVSPPLVIGIDTIPQDTGLTVSLWVDITADTLLEQAVFTLKGTVQHLGAPPVFFDPSYIFQPGPLTIPIAEWVDYPMNRADGFLPTPLQFVFDHVNNRYPGGDGNFSLFGQGTVFNFRGTIGTTGSEIDQDPDDLENQLFYPGDVVTVYGYGSIDSNICPCVGQFMFTGTAPAFFSINWDDFTSQISTISGFPNPQIFPLSSDSNWSLINCAPDATIWEQVVADGGPPP